MNRASTPIQLTQVVELEWRSYNRRALQIRVLAVGFVLRIRVLAVGLAMVALTVTAAVQIRVLAVGLAMGALTVTAAVRIRVLAVGLAMVALTVTPSPGLAEPLVSLDPAPDGTLVLVGSGWRSGQRLVVSVGPASFPALADSVGDFEVPTGLVSTGGPPGALAVHRVEALNGLSPLADVPHPLAVLFAQSLMTGAAYLVLSAAGVGFVSLAVRWKKP